MGYVLYVNCLLDNLSLHTNPFSFYRVICLDRVTLESRQGDNHAGTSRDLIVIPDP